MTATMMILFRLALVSFLVHSSSTSSIHDLLRSQGLPAEKSSSSTSSIHDLLRSHGLPAGLFPKNGVRSFDLGREGLLQVYFDSLCVAKIETRVSFDSVVRANLSYGGLIGVEGLSQEELFLWLPVKDIIVDDPSSGLILFDIGVARKYMSLSLFEDPPTCYPQGELVEGNAKRGFGFESA